jgi:putative phage-type endonuclease
MFQKIKNWSKIQQKTPEWFNLRKGIITASDVSSILEINPFKSKHEVFNNKIKQNVVITETVATRWGEHHEPLAREFYEKMPLINGKRKVHEVGLVIHDTYKWLAASPDGVVESLENKDWWLLEIKCPYKRDFKKKGDVIPSYIWIQTQIQMEVCDLPFCHLLQCKYETKKDSLDMLDTHLTSRRITTIQRDRDWFEDVALPQLQEFWALIQRNKTHIFPNPYPNPNIWVSLNSFNGFLLKDPILDWLNMYKNEPEISNLREDIPQKYKKKNIFESVLASLQKFSIQYNLSIAEVTPLQEKWNEAMSVKKFQLSKELLLEKTDIIVRPVLLDYKDKFYGIPDFVIKKRVLNKFFKQNYKKVSGIKNLKGNDEYVVLSVTHKERFPEKSFLSKWDNTIKTKYTGYSSIINTILDTDKTLISFTAKQTPIVIDPDTYNFCNTKEGVEWARILKKRGKDWLKNVDSDVAIKMLMPNMCNKYDQEWRGVKKILAERWGELTLLWYCGVEQRNRAHEKGIYSWKSNYSPKEIVKSLYSTNDYSQRKSIISSMISLNRTPDKIYMNRNMGELTEPYLDTENALEIMFDFEVLSGKNLNNNHSQRLRTPQDIIYLCGMAWKTEESLEFKSFSASSLTKTSERNMLQEWWSYVRKLKKETKAEKVILYHWSPAEERFLKRAFERHSLPMKEDLNSGKYDLRDLMEMFIESETVIRGVWGYSVKDISKGLYNYGLIPEIWKDNEKGGDITGERSVTTATSCYRENLSRGYNIQNNPNFSPLVSYNRTDCVVMYYLLLFLREYVYCNDARLIRRNKRKKAQGGRHKKKRKTSF